MSWSKQQAAAIAKTARKQYVGLWPFVSDDVRYALLSQHVLSAVIGSIHDDTLSATAIDELRRMVYEAAGMREA